MSQSANMLKKSTRRNNVGLGRMLLLSLALHLLMFVVLGGFVAPRMIEEKKQVYHVDLLHKPVAKPRSGRPDAGTVKKKKQISKKKKIVKPVTKKKVKAAVEKKPVKVVTKKKPVVVTKPDAKPVAAKPVKPVEDSYASETQDVIAEMRRKKRIADLKNQLNDLAHDPLPTTDVVDAPVGVVGGTGSQAGVSYDGWIKAFLSEAWALPSHYHQRGLVAKMLLRFNAAGRLIHYEMLSPSGDTFFDASVKRAVQQLQQLPGDPEKQMELVVTFDPREMLQ